MEPLIALSDVTKRYAPPAWLTIAVVGQGLASTMSPAVLERTREIGVLTAIGARHGRIMLRTPAAALAYE